MAALSLRLRRALTVSSSLLNGRYLSSLSPSTPSPLAPQKPYSPLDGNPSSRPPHSLIQAEFFRSSVSINNRFDQNEKEFDGCDYKHWLITMDFPKDPMPSRQDMIIKYFDTATIVFGSWRVAKKKIYALSTTTYHGFQCLMDKATSEKFRGLPGVVSIDPDRYIDPVNKEYGGDKFEHGIVLPRHPQHFIRSYHRSKQDGRGYGRPKQDGRGYGRPKQDGRGYCQPLLYGTGYGQPPQDGGGFGPPPHDGRDYGQLQDGLGFGQLLQDGRGFGLCQGLSEEGDSCGRAITPLVFESLKPTDGEGLSEEGDIWGGGCPSVGFHCRKYCISYLQQI